MFNKIFDIYLFLILDNSIIYVLYILYYIVIFFFIGRNILE